MTTTVVERSGDGANGITRPIVLALGCPDNQRYLAADNALLQSAYRVELTRIDVDPKELGGHYIWPNADTSEYEILKERTSMSVDELRSQLKSGWAERVVSDRFMRLVSSNSRLRRDWIRDVTAIIIASHMVGDDTTLRAAFTYSFPRVDFYSLDTTYRTSKPKRIWNEPNCHRCGKQMRESENDGPERYRCINPECQAAHRHKTVSNKPATLYCPNKAHYPVQVQVLHETGNIYRCPVCDRTYDQDGEELQGA